MSLSLAGGAQACAYLCGPGVAVKTVATGAKPACHGCGGKKAEKPAPAPEKPCKQCEASARDRVAVKPADATKDVTPVLAAVLPVPAAMQGVGLTTAAVEVRSALPPPLDRLSQFCILLI